MLEQLADELAFELLELDIESDDDLLRRLLERIPVIAVDGRELCELRVDEPALRACLASAAMF